MRSSDFIPCWLVSLLGLLITTISLYPQTALALIDENDLSFTSREKLALEKLKTKVSGILTEDFMSSDFYLIRWLRAANLDVARARAKLLETVKWRQQNNMSTILSEDWSDMEQDFPMSFEGHDKAGRPLWTIEVGDWNIRSAALEGKTPRLLRYFYRGTEKAMQNVFLARGNSTEKPVTRGIVITDAGGFNARLHACVQCMPTLMNWILAMTQHYPSFQDESIIINAPQPAVVTLNAIRTVMSQEMRKIIKVFNEDKSLWMKYLDERIDRKERSENFGGTRVD